MWCQPFFKSLTSTSTRRRLISRRTPASRLCLEALEDRRLLSFSPAVSYPVGLAPQAVAAADFNGDGRLDLAVANYSSDSVSVLLGNAGGTFQPAQNSATGAGPLSLAVGDFNADGKLDLASANAGDVSVLLGNGLGGFGAPTNTGLGSSPTSVAVGDFNADGTLDLGVASSLYVFDGCGYYGCYSHYEGQANVLLGNGAGAFAAPIVSVLGYGYQTSAAVADFNGDGNLDFAAAFYEYGTVNVVLGSGTGTFGSPVAFSAGYYSYSMAAGDVNADGNVDLVTANFYGSNVSVLLGNGMGSFGAAQTYFAGSQPLSVAMANFNGDGHIDLATANTDSGTVSVLLGAGAGAFKPPVNVTAGSYPLRVTAGDFNGDSRPDVATANSSSNSVSVLLNDGVWPTLDAPSITIGDRTITEGNTGTTSAVFTVSLSAAYSQAVSVRYTTADGSATVADGDYQATSGTLTIAAGQTSGTINVLVNGDRLYEYSESFFVRLSDPSNAFVADSTGAGTILDDEPYISIEPYVSGTEGNSGTTAFNFIVTLSAAYDAPVTVDYATADLTPDEEYWYGPGATAGVDYTARSGTVTFAAGDASETITVLVHGDRLGEWDEYFFVNLSNPISALLSSSQSIGTIVNDEPYVSISSASAAEGNTGTTVMTFDLTLSAASDAPVTVDFVTADGSATLAGGDYQGASGTVTFAATQTSALITVLVNGDRLGEYDEYFYVNLTGATGALIIGSTGYGTIIDNEPRVTISNPSLKEGNSGTQVMTFTVTLSAAYDQSVSFNFATQDGSATVADNDYVATSGTLTFAPGQTTKTISVVVKGDKKKESDESFYVVLSGATNALLSSEYGLGTILNDEGGRGKRR